MATKATENMIDWTQVLVVLVSVGLSAGSLSAVLGYALAVRRENAQNALISAAGVDKRVDAIWGQTVELFQSERERVKADMDELRAALNDERRARQALQAELDAERAARQDLAERVRQLEAENARLRTENEELRAGVRLRKL
jgi:Skp family chaperone for outer membrane proteins